MLHIVGSVSSCFSQEATSFTINSQPVSCDGEFQSILKDDFGSGTAEYGPQPAASNFTTTYSYTASGAVSPDRYGLLKNAFLGNICWSSDGDHTTGKSGDGYMLVFDANSVLGSVFYEKNYSGLCEGNVCNFSIYATNLTPTSYPVFSVKPMVKIDLINPLNGQILKSMVSSQLQLSESNALLWNELSLTFTIPAGLSAVKLRVSNAQTDTNGSGNDIAFDDVSFSICVPSLTFSLANEKICAGESNTIKASINNPAVPYHYQWQQSNGTTWTDIAGEISAEYKTPLLNKNTKYRIRYAQIGTDITNNNNLNCSGNKEIELQVTPRAKAADIELQSNFPICEGSQITLTPSSHAGTNFYWYDGSGSSATLLSSNSTYETGILTSSKTFYVAVSGDNYCENKPEDRKAVTVTVTPKPADIVTTKTICSGQTYTWPVNNVEYSTTQTGFKIINDGCTADQVLNLTVTPKPADIVTTKTICSGQTYTWPVNNVEYSTTQTGFKIINDGCTADQVLNLTVTPKPADIVTTKTICSGQTYTWPANDIEYSTSQTGFKITNDGCTADQVLNLTITPKPANVVTTKTICSGQTYTWPVNNVEYAVSQSGLRISNDGCTADQVLNLTVTPKPADIVTSKTICSGQTYIWPVNNVEYSTSQTGFKITNDGCTADQVLNLTVTPKPADIITSKTICSGQTYTWPVNNVEYTVSQSGLRISNDGCTADQVLNLTVTPKPADIVTTKTICSGQTYIWPANNVEYSTTQTGFKIINDGCTADQVLNLTVTPKPADIVTTKTICSGQTYIWPANNVEYTVSQSGLKISNDGCTADQVLNLTVTPKPADIVTTKTICSGQTYIWPVNNVEYSTSQTGFKIINDGCTADQVLNLTVTPKPADIVTTKTICSGQTYTWPANDIEYSTTQTGFKITNDGCTADQVLNLTVTPKPAEIVTTKTICSGQTYTWPANNVEYTVSQTGLRISNDGCTADQVLNLTVTPKPADIVTTKTICSGQTYIWPANNVEYSTTQTGFKITNDGCTANQVLNLTVTPKPADIVTTKTICSGQTYIWPANNVEYVVSQSGLRISNDGCTADQILNLTVTPKPADIVTTKTICSGQTYIWPANDVEYSTTQTEFKIINDGCTADQVLNLTVTSKPADVVTTETICSGQTYTWPVNNVEYAVSQSGLRISNDGCTADQILNLTVTAKPAKSSITQTICSGETFHWTANDKDYNTAGTYTVVHNGCTADEELILNVTRKPAKIVTEKTICAGETFHWMADNTDYNTAGTYTVIHNGCNADEELNLIVNKISATYTQTNAKCKGESSGSVIINPHGGTGIYTITPSQIGLSAGTHSFTITDSNNCFTTIDVVISEPNQLQANIVGPINPEYCTGENNGSFSMEISGGTKPYHYSLDQEAGIFSDGSSHQSLFDIENISAGQHTVYVKDAQGCTTQLQVNLPAAVVINPIVAITRFCQGNTIGNAVTVTIDSSVNPADVDYALDEGIYQSSNIFTNLSPGEHTIKARHSNGCLQSTAVFIIDEVKPLKLTLANGELNEIVATASEGGVNYQYSFDDEPFSSNNKLIIYKSGNYTVTVKDSNGCSITLSKYFDYIDVCIPNYFTPNGDGVNDDWGPDCSVNYKNLTFTILDRYGREIAKYHYGQRWDGKYNGQELTSGDYWYVIKLNDPKDNREFVGHFTLYR